MVFGGFIQYNGTVSYEDYMLQVSIPDRDITSFNIGDSVAVNGVCLTISEIDSDKNIVFFQMSEENY